MQTHDPKSYRSMAQIGALRRRHRIVVDVDYVIEHPHHNLDRVPKLGVIDRSIRGEMSWDVNGGQIAYRHFFTARIQCDLGTKIRVVDNTHVILRGA